MPVRRDAGSTTPLGQNPAPDDDEGGLPPPLTRNVTREAYRLEVDDAQRIAVEWTDWGAVSLLNVNQIRQVMQQRARDRRQYQELGYTWQRREVVGHQVTRPRSEPPPPLSETAGSAALRPPVS